MTPELIEKAKAYVNGGFLGCDDVIPSIAGLAFHLDVHRETLRLWGKDNEMFFGILERLGQNQEKTLLTGGLTGEMNSQIAKLVLAKQGYKESAEIDHTTNGKDVGIPIHNFVKSE